jgi:hypothetical protein
LDAAGCAEEPLLCRSRLVAADGSLSFARHKEDESEV